MAPRRQPYSQTPPASTPGEPVDEKSLQTEDGGLQIDLSDVIPAGAIPKDDHVSEPPAAMPAVREPEKSADDEAFAKLKTQLERSERERLEAQNRLGRMEQERSTVEDSLRNERERAEQMRREHLATRDGNRQRHARCRAGGCGG